MTTTLLSLRPSTNRRAASKVIGRIDWDAARAIPIGEARAVANSYSRAIAGTATAVLITPPDANPKAWKSAVLLGRPTVLLTLLPSTDLGDVLASVAPIDALGAAVLAAYRNIDACVHATAGCRAACLNTSGHGQFSSTIRGRAYRAAMLLGAPLHFVRLLIHELEMWARRFAREGVTGAVRLNTVSDHDWTLILPELCAWIVETFGEGTLYDYTADATAARHTRARALGYDLSLSLKCADQIPRYLSLLSDGTVNRVVAVFGVRAKKVRGEYPSLPSSFYGLPVTNGDAHDYRPLDGTGVIVGLRVKDTHGRSTVAAALESGFAMAV